ncbi:N-6 DNA methylase [Flavobacterium sp. GP15]|uniref:N-6 DNA methylase n=1 Tax=Flavobacterium sp. GP15 TaxID=2758567 RepID=UPI00165E116A|nr:N-6 DNA methylase [Flavobacterium sp. GP15]
MRITNFLCLYGGSGDFCLQTSNLIENPDTYFGISWSTNTKNFVIIDNDNVKISNWFDKKIEEIPLSKIESNSDKFYKYLISKSYKSESDVVPFILDIFRKLRNVTYEKEKPTDALNLLFQLLISIEEDYTKIDYTKWGIENVELPSQFEYFVDLIKQGVKSISPNLDLILRHSSGSLFQEAHREVIYFNPQRDLFGGVSSKLIVKNDAYSSIHYTPQYLARTIVENSLKNLLPLKEYIKIFDPSCGSSEFLIEALKQLKNAGFDGKVKVIGWDTSESAVSTSKFLLEYEKRTQWSNSDLEFEIKLVNDSLTEKWESDYDLILMNPPFISWELLKSRESKDAVLETLGSSFKNGKPNQASAFFYKATKSLNTGGVLGCVLPSSIFTFDSYSSLRNEIKEELNLNIIARLGNFVFEDALTDVSFFVGKKEVHHTNPKLIWTKNEKGVVHNVLRDLRKMTTNNEHSIEEKSYSIYTPSDFPLIKDSWKTISLNENKLMKDVERFVSAGNLNPISEIFNINQGALLGVKNIFKISLEQFENLPKNEHKFFRPVITNNSIKKGELIISEYVWFPYDKNGLIIKNENELNNITFAKEVLIPNKVVLQNRKSITEWWSLTRPRNWQFGKQIRLYSNRFGNSNSFALDIKGNCVIEEGNAFLPKKEFEIDDYYFYLSCFTSKTFEILLSIYSKPIMSGYDLGKIQIKDIPIPNVHSTLVKNSEAYAKLVELGKELEQGNSFVKQVIDDVLNSYFYPRI